MVRAKAQRIAHSLPVLCFAAGCFDVELIEPREEPRDRLARSTIQIDVAQGDQLTIGARIILDAGTDSDGNVRRLEDPTVLLQDQAISPIRQPRLGVYEYQHDIAYQSPESAPRQFDIILPTLDDPGYELFGVSLPVLLREGPISIMLDPGEDLTLTVDRPPPPDSVTAWWTVDLAQSCGAGGTRYASMDARGWPPGSIRIPSTLLETVPTSIFEACLYYGMTLRNSSDFYLATASTRGVHAWHVEIDAGADSGRRTTSSVATQHISGGSDRRD